MSIQSLLSLAKQHQTDGHLVKAMFFFTEVLKKKPDLETHNSSKCIDGTELMRNSIIERRVTRFTDPVKERTGTSVTCNTNLSFQF